MKPPEVRKLLLDMEQACSLIDDFCRERTLDDYRADPMFRSAVERQFEVVGEALRQAISRDASLAVSVKDSSRIIAFRNRLIHGYASVADAVVWGVVEASLPRLRADIAALLTDESGSKADD